MLLRLFLPHPCSIPSSTDFFCTLFFSFFCNKTHTINRNIPHLSLNSRPNHPRPRTAQYRNHPRTPQHQTKPASGAFSAPSLSGPAQRGATGSPKCSFLATNYRVVTHLGRSSTRTSSNPTCVATPPPAWDSPAHPSSTRNCSRPGTPKIAPTALAFPPPLLPPASPSERRCGEVRLSKINNILLLYF